MVNMNVKYLRPARSLTTLRDELDSVWKGRGADLGFITGAPSPGNFTGHNPNELGICMGYDIGVHANGRISPADGRALAEHLRREANEKFQYLIHDMGTNGVRPMIAGNHTRWAWEGYSGPHPHSDHIHISVVDLYWGDNCGVPAGVYDSTGAWGVAARFGGSPAPKPGPAPATPGRKTYGLNELHWVVQPGDTLTRIANYYRIPGKVHAIARHNGIHPDKIKVGERIWIPGPLSWSIALPDTVRSVAAYYGMDPGFLARLNGLSGPDAEIFVGRALIIKH